MKPVSAKIEAKVNQWLANGKVPHRITLHSVDFRALVRELRWPVDRHGVIAKPIYWQSGEHSIRVVSASAKSYHAGTVYLH